MPHMTTATTAGAMPIPVAVAAAPTAAPAGPQISNVFAAKLLGTVTGCCSAVCADAVEAAAMNAAVIKCFILLILEAVVEPVVGLAARLLPLLVAFFVVVPARTVRVAVLAGY